MDLRIEATDKWSVLRAVKDQLILRHGLVMDDVDEQKPWGAYYRFVPSQRDAFVLLFFKGCDIAQAGESSPKLLVFAPGQKISLQYHERRDEVWRVLHGAVDAYFGDGDALGQYRTYGEGELFHYKARTRHKGGASAAGWAVVAELWQHTDPSRPSDEADNIRLLDDFGRA